VYDPMQEAFIERWFQIGGVREVWIGDSTQKLNVVAEERGGQLHEEWTDARQGTLRIEVNGVYLAGRRCTVAEASAALTQSTVALADQQRSLPAERLSAILPHPGWRWLPRRDAVLELEDPATAARAQIVPVDTLPEGASLHSALEAARRTVHLNNTDVRETSAPSMPVSPSATGEAGGQPTGEPSSLDWFGTARQGPRRVGGAPPTETGQVVVDLKVWIRALPTAGGPVAITMSAPAKQFERAALDFQRLLTTVSWATPRQLPGHATPGR
jgi:hypothetical protein